MLVALLLNCIYCKFCPGNFFTYWLPCHLTENSMYPLPSPFRLTTCISAVCLGLAWCTCEISNVLLEGGHVGYLIQSMCGYGSISDNILFLMRAEKIQRALKAGHHRASSETPYYASKTPIKRRFTGGPMMAKHWDVAHNIGVQNGFLHFFLFTGTIFWCSGHFFVLKLEVYVCLVKSLLILIF